MFFQIDDFESSRESFVDDGVFVGFEDEGHVLSSAKDGLRKRVSTVSAELVVAVWTVEDDGSIVCALIGDARFFNVEGGAERELDCSIFRNRDVDPVVLVGQVSWVSVAIREHRNGPAECLADLEILGDLCFGQIWAPDSLVFFFSYATG